MADLTRDAARALVEDIAYNHGYISPADWASMTPEVRRVVETALRKKDDMIASSVFTLARNLYSSTARFIFELLQNADDNKFTKAKRAGEEPYVSFSVYHDKLVMECNEDGFNEANLRAICDIGKSSKQGAQGYIGEKGIGFKSTFMAAWKVEIQSGPLSFYFSHRKEDSGLGMVTPIWTEPTNPQPGQPTTTTLYFHDHDGPEALKARRDEIISQLRSLSSEVLLFLQSLKVIKIAACDDSGRQLWSKVTRLGGSETDSNDTAVAWLQAAEQVGDTKMPAQIRRFYAISHQAENLAKNDNRTYTPEEEAANAYGKANVIVAFPFDDDWRPVIEAQELFAFMPIRNVGFNFLIHSDFVTQANRQDIVSTSERNIGLRDAIAMAFCKGVEKMCRQPQLRYTWMRYLPRDDNLPLDPFWRQLVPSIRNALMAPRLVFARDDPSEKTFSISQLRRLRGSQVDKDANPLIPDLPDSRMYISDKYEAADVGILVEYGLKFLEGKDLVPRLKAYTSTPGWRTRMMAIFARDEDWYSRVAKLLLRLWEESASIKSELKWMPLLPLVISLETPAAAAGGVFFPDIDGISIPNDLGFKLVSHMAALNPDCRKLFEKLGVRNAIMSAVRESIVKKHKAGAGLHAYNSDSHIRYFYLTDTKDPITADERSQILVFDQKDRTRKPKQEFIYFRGEGEDANTVVLGYSPEAEVISPDEHPADVDVSFLHKSYLLAPPKTPEGYDKDFAEWLYDIMWVEKNIQIFTIRSPKTEDPKIFTKEWIYLAQRRPDLIVSRLCGHWEQQKSIDHWVADPVGTEMIKTLGMLCTDGKLHPLRDSFVPLPSLIERCQLFLKDVEKMPFLKYPRAPGESDSGRIIAPSAFFEFGMADDLTLCLAILRAIIDGASQTVRSITESVVDLYLRIYAHCLASDNKEKSETQVRNMFQDHRGILCSPSLDDAEERGPREQQWAALDSCLLDAPLGFRGKKPVAEIFKQVAHALDPSNRETLELFFRHTLKIRTVTADDVIDELLILSKGSAESSRAPQDKSVDLKYVQELYGRLDGMTRAEGVDEDANKKLGEQLQKGKFIYVPSDSGTKCWFTVSECVWSTNGAVLGKTCLEPHYPDLAPFFVDFLRVRTLDLDLIMQDLVAIGGGSADIDYVKTLLWSLNTLLQGDAGNGGGPAFTDEAKAARIFPVRMPDGTVRTVTELEDFAINDRQSFAEALKSRVKFLDFSLAEVSRLQPLIQWAGLKSRCLSHSVIESTVVNDEVCTVDRYMTRNLAQKARAFASVLAHFNCASESLDLAALCLRLYKINVFLAEQITSTFSITQDGVQTTLPALESELHITTNATTGSWDIFLSADEDARDFAVTSRLPRELGALLLGCRPSRVDPRALGVLASIVHAKKRSVGRVLESNGIEERSDLPLPIREGADDDADDFETLSITGGRSTSRAVGGATRMSQESFFAGGHWEPPITEIGESPDTVVALDPKQNEPYVRLLEQVVQEARGLLDFPAQGETLAAGTQSIHRFSGGEQQVWRRMCGCAGELFVFELLSHLRPALPGFNLANWQSSVRGFASAHPEYSDLQNWGGSEGTDMFYSDASGTLTSLLVEKGYLDAREWTGQTPEYHIEVKTTMMGSVETPFYVSKWQYSRMRDMSNWPYKKKLYVLFRVYGLESGRIGFKLFVDPEDARKRGALLFESEGWTVMARR